MSKIALDLKKFKHIKSDDDSTTLQHADGHILTMHHKSLSPEFQKQLSALSKVASAAQTPLQKDESKHAQMAKGGSVSRYEEGGKAKQIPQHDTSGTARISNPIRKGDENEPPPNANDWLKEKLGLSDPKPQPTPEKSKDLRLDIDPQYRAEGGEIPQYAEGGPTSFNAIPDETPDSEAQMNQDINKEVEDSENFVHRTENPNYVQPVKKEAVPPDKEIVDTNQGMDRKREIYNRLVLEPDIMRPGFGGHAFGPKGEPPTNFSSDDWVEAEKQYAQEQSENAGQIAQAQQRAIQVNQQRTSAGLPPIPVPNVPQGPQIPGSEGNPPPNTPPDKALNPSSPIPDSQSLALTGGAHDPESMLASGYANKMQGISQTAQAAGKLGEQQAAAIDANVKSQEQAQSAFKQQYFNLENERQAHMQDIKEGYIDPNQYWTGDKNGNGGHSKMAAGIGMILAGFNPTNSPNAAINFIKFQMEQNLTAQKENLGAKQNLLTANLKQFGNLRDATDMTRIMQHDIMANELQSAAAKAQTPVAKAAALQAAGALQMEAAPMFQQFAMRRAMMNLAQNGGSDQAVSHMIGYMRVVNPEMAKEMESRQVPGVGLANIPVPQDVRSQIIAHQKLDTAAKDLEKWTKTHTTIIPGTPDYNTGLMKAQNLQQMIRHGQLQTVYREGEQPLLDKMVQSNPGNFLKNFNTMPKLREVLKSNEMQYNTLKQGYGLPVQQTAPEQQIKTVNGVKYMRGPNGEAIKVK